MKRTTIIGILALIGLGLSYLASCSTPLDNRDLPSNNTPSRIDTIYVFDTLTPSDTAFRIDTVRVTDTIRITDSGRRIDTVVRFDTIRVNDSAKTIDTVIQVDTVRVKDHRIDTVRYFDTVLVHDSQTVVDTIIQIDTVTVTNTIVRVDTVRINDSSACNPEPFCGQLSPAQKELVWMFRNEQGDYHLEFSGFATNNNPLQTVILNIDGIDYTWKAAEIPLLIKDMTLSANTTIHISLGVPPAYGHEINVCLTMTKQ